MDFLDKEKGTLIVMSERQSTILNVSNNSATHGGGFNFEENSKLYIQGDGNKISFKGNKAIWGGAIFINDNTTASICASDSFKALSINNYKTECFVQKSHHIIEGYSLTLIIRNDKLESPIEFTENLANETGSILFGGLLDRCTVSPLYNKGYC